jgi:hypothetical protein
MGETCFQARVAVQMVKKLSALVGGRRLFPCSEDHVLTCLNLVHIISRCLVSSSYLRAYTRPVHKLWSRKVLRLGVSTVLICRVRAASYPDNI